MVDCVHTLSKTSATYPYLASIRIIRGSASFLEEAKSTNTALDHQGLSQWITIRDSDSNDLQGQGSYGRDCSRQFILVDVPDIFYFFLLGGGEGVVLGNREGGGSVFIENPRRGGGLPEGGGGVRGPGGCLQGIPGRGG